MLLPGWRRALSDHLTAASGPPQLHTPDAEQSDPPNAELVYGEPYSMGKMKNVQEDIPDI